MAAHQQGDKNKLKQMEPLQANSRLHTVIFDMDGLLIDSEPLWEEAGTELLVAYGCQLTPELYAATVGLRTQEWLQYWFHHFGIRAANLEQAEQSIVDSVIAKVEQQPRMMAGVHYILDYFKQRGFKIALATSSPLRMAEKVVALLGIGHFFEVLTSAEHMPYGKPHPQVYLQCAQQLQVDPLGCLCFEDSFNGMIAAKAAKMKCVVVPAASQLTQARWGAADLKLSSLQNFNDLLLAPMMGG
ncbi:MAG: hexitol phosphatase HxpB [Chitinophagaceae bacterium]|nr:hexitol phosphatase HxpB [Chitinophagaceae bacterium]